MRLRCVSQVSLWQHNIHQVAHQQQHTHLQQHSLHSMIPRLSLPFLLHTLFLLEREGGGEYSEAKIVPTWDHRLEFHVRASPLLHLAHETLNHHFFWRVHLHILIVHYTCLVLVMCTDSHGHSTIIASLTKSNVAYFLIHCYITGMIIQYLQVLLCTCTCTT